MTATTLSTGPLLVSPCHGKRCVGGPARVWCPTCGRGYQADDGALHERPEERR